MTIASDNVGNRRQMYINSCMNVPKQSQLVQKNDTLFIMCTRGWGGCFLKNDVMVLKFYFKSYSVLAIEKNCNTKKIVYTKITYVC